MGMFDRVWIPCPSCGEKFEEQSKVHDCVLADYTLENAPPEILLDILEHPMDLPYVCEKCGARFQVALKPVSSWKATVVLTGRE